MTTSHKTARAIYKALAAHVQADQMEDIIADLLLVEGNSSFRETMRIIADINDAERGVK